MDTRELIEQEARKVLANYYRAGGNGGMADDIMRDNWRVGSSPAEMDIVRAIAEALSSQAAEIERLREALRPFAVAGSTLPDYVPDHRYTEVSAGHLRRAHIVYAALTPKPNKEGE